MAICSKSLLLSLVLLDLQDSKAYSRHQAVYKGFQQVFHSSTRRWIKPRCHPYYSIASSVDGATMCTSLSRIVLEFLCANAKQHCLGCTIKFSEGCTWVERHYIYIYFFFFSFQEQPNPRKDPTCFYVLDGLGTVYSGCNLLFLLGSLQKRHAACSSSERRVLANTRVIFFLV